MTSTLISASIDTSFTPNNCAPLSQQRSERTSSTADNERRAKRQGSDHSVSAAKLMRSTSTSVTMSNEPARTDDDNEEAEGMNETDLFVQSRYSGVAQEDRSEDSDVKRVLSVAWSGGKLGSSYYDSETSQLHLQMDVIETNEFQFLKRVREQVQPHIIITSSKQDQRLLKILHGEAYEVCKRRITALNGLPGMPQHFTDNERDIYMTSLVPLDNFNMVRSAGALIKYIDKKRIGVELEDPATRVPILSLKVFSLNNLLIVDNNTYSALQIFQKERHPSVYKMGTGNSGSKEGLSLFGIMNRTRSVLGGHMLRMWFLRPSRDVNLLKQRHKAVSFFMSPRNAELVASLQDSLKHIKNVSRVLSRMKTAQASVGDWQALYKTAYNGTYIADLCKTIPVDIEIARRITTKFTDELHGIGSLISKIIDFDESTEQNRFVVKPRVDPALDEKKRTYNGLPDFMTKVAREELNKLSSSITECNVVYLPQLGYLLAIPRSKEMKEEKDFALDGLEFVFLSNNRVHYKSASTRELDNLLGDTQCEITDHETAIMHRLQTVILEHTKVLVDVMDCCAELDCLISLALCARENNYVCPQLTTSSVLNIEQGRHPLQELCVSQFVPNDSIFCKESSRLKILTGPNASGKSVYLKQVGLIVFLAHIGSFVPADSAIIGITDRVFTRIHTRETVSIALSTFMIDLNQVATAVQGATENSLVIIDEFGKGTATIDGLSLLSATLRHWLARGSGSPKILVSTHFHGLIRQNLLPQSSLINYQTMQVIQEDEELVFLYQLVDGQADSSFACHIASLAGVPNELIKRAYQVTELVRSNKPLQRKDAENTEDQNKRFKATVLKFLKLNLEKEDPQVFLTDLLQSEN
ncbi:mutS protein homolog 5-like isoform X3 [Acropora millepora]|uniref:mutS protein homolog 5-like isoform X3 n=1 Tax=Acropora millepora TaxID=45264 RepID=UPI001CF23A7A|nr:mutS protein homolog 5-like isoform X3 [Acropora millepora]